MRKKRESQVSELKDFEIPLPQSIKDRLDKVAASEGQATTALARSILIDGIREREKHEMERAQYQAETNTSRQNTPQKTR